MRSEIRRLLALAALMAVAAIAMASPFLPQRVGTLAVAGWMVTVAALLGYTLATRRWGTLWFVLGFVVFSIIPTLMLLMGACAALIMPLVHLGKAVARRTRAAWLACAAALALPFVFLASVVLWRELRRWGLGSAARHCRPVIAAIERHRTEKGRYPESLDELVPAYLPVIPHSGMWGYRTLHYTRAAAPNDGQPMQPFRSYELKVNCWQLMQFDSFVYWPEGGYPNAFYGGGVTDRVEGWAYVTE